MGASRKHITHTEEVIAAVLVRAGLAFEYERKEFVFHLEKEIDPVTGELEYIRRGFRPDFYIPELELYIEAGSVRHKRHKLRRMRRLYPNVRVLVIDNSWAPIVAELEGEDVLNYINEKWVEQEYMNPLDVAERIAARTKAITPGPPSMRPSMRCR